MKKFAGLALAALTLLSLAACGAKSEAKELDLTAFAGQVIEAVEYDDDMVLLSEQIVSEYYSLPLDGVEGWVAYGSGTAATTNELLVIKLKDDASIEAVRQAVEHRIDDQVANYEGYRPDELFRLENAIIETEGNYLLFSVSSDNDTVKKMFEDALK